MLRQNLYNPTEYYQICIIILNLRQLLIHFSYIKFPNKQNIVANKSCHMAIATETLEHSHIIITRAKVKKNIFLSDQINIVNRSHYYFFASLKHFHFIK